jgi:hypothetical protein
VIYAWEVMNEPAWDIRRITKTLTGYVPHPPFVDDSALKEFLRLGIAWIDDKKFPSTVGHRFLSDLGDMATGTKRQFHYYSTAAAGLADPSVLPAASATGGAFVGEFGALIGKGYEANETPRKAQYGEPWDRDLPDGSDRSAANTVYVRLKKLKELGYDLALVWPEYEDSTVDAKDGLKISPLKLASIKRFVDGR